MFVSPDVTRRRRRTLRAQANTPKQAERMERWHCITSSIRPCLRGRFLSGSPAQQGTPCLGAGRSQQQEGTPGESEDVTGAFAQVRRTLTILSQLVSLNQQSLARDDGNAEHTAL